MPTLNLTDQELADLHWLLAVAKSGSACKNYDLGSKFVFLDNPSYVEPIRQKVLAVMNKAILPKQEYPSWVNSNDLPIQKLTWPILWQRDPRWKDKPLGTSSSTLGGYGCLVTCFAMLAGLMPDTMNAEMVKRGMFYQQNLAATFDISPINSRIKFLGTYGRYYSDIPAADMKKLTDHLQSGQPAILEVDINAAQQGLQQHFVLATGIVNGKIVCNDPWIGDNAPVSPRYGNTDSLAIWRFILYSVV